MGKNLTRMITTEEHPSKIPGISHWLPTTGCLTGGLLCQEELTTFHVVMAGGQQRLVTHSALLVPSTQVWCSQILSINRVK